MHAITKWVWVAAATVLASPQAALAQRAPDEGLLFVGKPARVDAGRSVETAIVIGDDLVIAGNVDGVAATVGGDLYVLAGARVDGAVAAIGGELRIEPGATVHGPRIVAEGGDFQQVAAHLSGAQKDVPRAPGWLGSAMRVAQMLALFVIGIFLVTLAPKQIEIMRSTLVQQPSRAGWLGFGWIVGTIPLCALLAISLIGIPLIPLVILLSLAMCAFGMTAVAATLGYVLPLSKDNKSLFTAMALGVLVLTIGAALPLFGGLMLLAASSLGTGAVLLSRFGTHAPPPAVAPPPGAQAPPPQAETATARS